jgi:hypothetical protein
MVMGYICEKLRSGSRVATYLRGRNNRLPLSGFRNQKEARREEWEKHASRTCAESTEHEANVMEYLEQRHDYSTSKQTNKHHGTVSRTGHVTKLYEKLGITFQSTLL